MVEDEGINFNNSPLRMEDLEATPIKMANIRAEVQDPLKEVNLGTTEQPQPTFVSSLLEEDLKDEIIELLKEFAD